jgi:6-phosphofructokinase 1
LLVERIKYLYELQKKVVIMCGEGIVDSQGRELGGGERHHATTDPSGNKQLSGAAESLRTLLIKTMGDRYFKLYRRGNTAHEAIFSRKVGHTQRSGHPIAFDRFHAAQLDARTVEMLLEGCNNAMAVLQWNPGKGFSVGDFVANRLHDRWDVIHARQLHSDL